MKRAEPHLLNRKLIRRPTPTVAVLELTNICNQRCFHCLRDSPGDDGGGELTTTQWIKIIDELAAMNVLCVSFSGGEPTTRPDLVELIRHARSRGLVVSLKTNGLTLAGRIAEHAAAGLGQLEISLYGVRAETHERCTGIPGSHDRTRAGIDAALQAGIPVILAFFLFRWNADEVAAMRALAEELGCEAKRDYLLLPSDAGRRFEADFVTATQIRAIEEAWPGATRRENQNGGDGLTICAQGLNILGVTARGELLPCSALRRPFGNALRDGIAEPWKRLSEDVNRPALRIRGVDYRRFTRCAACELLEICRICPGENLTAAGAFESPPLERCFISQVLYGRVVMNDE
jgi:radical SAM protein with 4Fe4S-binding SPASM domain